MRYLKLFENYPSPRGFTPNSIEEDVNDIFIELKDNGYKIEYQRFNESGDNVSLTIKYRRGFNSNDVREYVIMFIDYMTDKFGEQRVFYRGRTPAYESGDTFYANGKVFTTDDFPDDTELTALKICVNAKYKDKNQTKLQLENYRMYNSEIKKNISDILVELIDNGFKYIFNDIREGLTITLEKGYYDTFKKSDIVDTFLMLEDYMREEWGNDIKITYEYHSIGAGTGRVNVYGKTPTGMKEQPEFKIHTITDIKMDSLILVKFMCSVCN